MKKAAIILSGCGYKDGTEIHEAVLSYLALAEIGIGYYSFSTEKMLAASAPIARDQIDSLKMLHEKDYDILWMPGGFGVAKHLSTYASEGIHCSIDPEVKRVIDEFYRAKKPIVAICIAPVVLAKALQGKGIKMTLGTSKEQNQILTELGMNAEFTKVDEVCFDKNHNIYTTPGYMEPPSITGIYHALTKIVGALT